MNRGENGSVLALVPAGFLVLMLLAALAVDSAVAYLGQRQLRDTLSVAATDAATAGLDNASFYRGGQLTLDPSATARTACLSVAAQNDGGLHAMHLWIGVQGDRVEIRGTARVDAVFGRIVPGLGHRQVSSTAEAVGTAAPLSGPATGAGPLVPLSCPGL